MTEPGDQKETRTQAGCQARVTRATGRPENPAIGRGGEEIGVDPRRTHPGRSAETAGPIRA